jgi:type I restriction enzyme S subunit
MKPSNNNTPPQGYKMTELGALPEEWEVARLGDVAYFETGKRMKGGALERGEVLSLGGEHIGNFGELNLSQPKYITKEFYDNLKKGKVNVGDVIICKDGAKTGKLAYIKKEFNYQIAINEHVFIIRSKNSQFLHNHFIFFFLFSNFGQNQIREAFHGLIGGITNSDIFNFLIPLPPLPEQQKIAAVLSAVQEAKEKTEAVIAAAKALKKSMMKHLFTYGPVSPEETETVSLKETEIGPVPKDWEVVKLGEIAENRKETVDPNKEDIIYVGLEHINSGDSKLTRYGNSREIKSSKSRFYKDDILYAKLRPYLDKGILAEFEGICSTDILVIKPNKELINPQFLTDLLHMPNFLDFATKSMTGVNHPRTSWSILKTFKIPLPSLPTQQKIASILSAIDAKIEAEENKKKALEELFKSLLHNLMTGKIRVNNLKLNEKDI